METQFVAEVSSNHNSSLARCLEFVDCAAEIGCDAIKFQLFKIDELFAPEILATSEDHRRRRAWELPVKFIPDIYKRCVERGIQFSCTPFYLDAVDELYPYVSFYKIASYELLWNDLLISCAKTGKPVVLSTGMATLPEVAGAVSVLRGAGCDDLTLLHCVSGYPTPPADCNLSAIATMRNEFACKIGWSDHSANANVIRRAVYTWKSSMIEFHLDLDGTGDEYKIGHCWLPKNITPLIAEMRNIDIADGDGIKHPAPAELSDVEWRADPSDGLRPTLKKRAEWIAGDQTVAVKAFRS